MWHIFAHENFVLSALLFFPKKGKKLIETIA